MVRLSGAKSHRRDGLVGGIAREEVVRLSGAKSRRRDGLVGGIAREEVVPRGGIEPPTLRFSVACSTN